MSSQVKLETNLYIKEYKDYLYFFIKNYKLEINNSKLLVKQVLNSIRKLTKSDIKYTKRLSSNYYINIKEDIKEEFNPEVYLLICRINTSKLEVKYPIALYSNIIESLLDKKVYVLDPRINLLDLPWSNLKKRQVLIPIQRAKVLLERRFDDKKCCEFIYVYSAKKEWKFYSEDISYLLDNSDIEIINTRKSKPFLKVEFYCKLKVLERIRDNFYKERKLIFFCNRSYSGETTIIYLCKDKNLINLFKNCKSNYYRLTSVSPPSLISKKEKDYILFKSLSYIKSDEIYIPFDYINNFQIINLEESNKKDYIYRLKEDKLYEK